MSGGRRSTVTTRRGGRRGGAPADDEAPPAPADDEAPPAPFDVAQLMTVLATVANQATVTQEQLSTITAAIAALNVARETEREVTTNVHESDEPYNVNTRSGSAGMAEASSPLNEFFSFDPSDIVKGLRAIQTRAIQLGWSRDGPINITKVAGKNIFGQAALISQEECDAAYTARTNARAKQNAEAMSKCILSSIKGNLLTTINIQAAKAIQKNDGVSVFVTMVRVTAIASAQQSAQAMTSIYTFRAKDCDHSIVRINTLLMDLFALASLQAPMDKKTMINLTVKVYHQIKQPEQWARWTENVMDQQDEPAFYEKYETLEAFMATALVKANKIASSEGGFHGSSETLAQRIVAMIAAASSSKKRAREPASSGRLLKDAEPADAKPAAKSGSAAKSERDKSGLNPPWLKHSTDSKTGVPYQHGESKEWNDEKYYFCEIKHRGPARWHKWDSRDCNQWKKEQEAKGDGPQKKAKTSDETADAEVHHGAATDNSLKEPSVLLATALAAMSQDDPAYDMTSAALDEILKHT
jgi:hypothetical protein